MCSPPPNQQFARWPGTKETARSEIAPYPEITAKRGAYEVGRALRARRETLMQHVAGVVYEVGRALRARRETLMQHVAGVVVYEVGRALRARRSEAGSAILRIAPAERLEHLTDCDLVAPYDMV